jgi:Protein of unknown function (DUF3435)
MKSTKGRLTSYQGCVRLSNLGILVTPSGDALMKLIGHMSLTRDPNAPAEPTSAQRREAQADLEVIAAKKLVDVHTKNIFPPSEQHVSRTSTRVRRSLPVRLHRSIFQRTRSPCEVTVSLILSHSPGTWTSSIFSTFPKSRHSIVPTLLALWEGLFSRMQIISRITLCRDTASRILVDLELLEFEGFGEAGGAVGSTPKIATVECKPEQLRPEQDASLKSSQDYSAASGDPNQKYLALQGITLTNYWATMHPSEPNRCIAAAGENFGMENDGFNAIYHGRSHIW